MNLLPLAHSPKHETNSLISFLQSPIHSDADNLATLESLQDYTYLLHQLPEPQPHLQVSTWPWSEQTALQGQATWPQAFQPLFPPPRSEWASVQRWVLSPEVHTMAVQAVGESQASKLNQCESGYSHGGTSHWGVKRFSSGLHENVNCPHGY